MAVWDAEKGTEMSAYGKKSGVAKFIGAIAVILVAVAIGAAIYVVTGPHTAADALLAKPIAGPDSNYAAKGTVKVEAQAAEVDLPAAKIPFEIEVAGNRAHITLFPDQASSIYEIYLIEENGKIAFYDTGNASVLSTPALSFGSLLFDEDGSMQDALGLPDIMGRKPDAMTLANFATEATLEKGDSADTVHIDGASVAKLLVSMDSSASGELDGILGNLLDGGEITIVYGKDRIPQSATFAGGEITTDIDGGLFGTVNVKVDVSGEMEFERYGEVSKHETELPQGATKR